MKKLVKLAPIEFENCSRDLRELSVVKELGADIVIVAKGTTNEIVQKEGYYLHNRTTKPLGNIGAFLIFNRILSIFTWATYVKKLNGDYISCHDLIGLSIGWIACLFAKKNEKPGLIYDAHEFELGRNTSTERSYLHTKFVFLMENFLIKKCVFCMVVNDSIADEMFNAYHLKERPIVVRNIPEFWDINADVCKERKKKLEEHFEIKNPFIAMYHGCIFKGRGIEKILELIYLNSKLCVVILGNGEREYIKKLKAKTVQLGINNKVLFLDAVPLEVLWQYVGAADVGLITIPAICKSYYYMLPNKFFENIQSETPMICSDFPEIRRIIKKYEIGLLVDPEDINGINVAIEKLRIDKERYQLMKKNLKSAKKELCWKNEKKILYNAYARLLL